MIRVVGIVAAIALLVPVWPALVWVVVALVLMILTASAGEALVLQRVELVVQRPLKAAVGIGEARRERVRLQVRSRFSVRLIIRQKWPLIIAPPSEEIEAVSGRGEWLDLDFSIRAIARGTEGVAPLAVAMTIAGLVERIARAGAETQINVLPNLGAVARLHRQLNAFALRGLGVRAAPRLGKGREFDRLRDYVTDDDYRDVAWRASARHGRLIVREFRTERAQDVLICIDRGHRMAARVEEITRLDHALNAAVLIGYLCNRMDDRVGVLSFADEADLGLPAGRGRQQMRSITSYVTPIAPQLRNTDYLALAAGLKHRLRHRTLILILTVLPEREERHELLRAMQMLAPQHLPLLVVMNDRTLEAAARTLPASRSELSRTLVARDLWLGRVETMRDLRALGAMVVDSTPSDAGIDGVNAYIDIKRRQLL